MQFYVSASQPFEVRLKTCLLGQDHFSGTRGWIHTPEKGATGFPRVSRFASCEDVLVSVPVTKRSSLGKDIAAPFMQLAVPTLVRVQATLIQEC